MNERRRPRLVIAHHGADATPETVALVELVRDLTATGERDVEILLHAGGPLRDELESLAPTTVVTELERSSRDALVERGLFALRLRRAGFERRSRRLGLDQWQERDMVYLHSVLAVQTLRYLPVPAPRVICRLAEDVYPLSHPLRARDEALLLARVDRFLPVTAIGEAILLDEHAIAPERITRVPELFVPRDERLPDRTEQCDRLRAELGIAPDAHVIAFYGAYEADAPDIGVLVWEMLCRRLGPEATVEMLWWYQPTGAGFWMKHDLEVTGLERRTHVVPYDEELGPYLELCDILVLLTRETDFPFAYLERAAEGIPVLCFEINDMADLARLGSPDFVAPYLDLPVLADGLTRLAGGDELDAGKEAMAAAIDAVHGPTTFGRRLLDLAGQPATRGRA